MTKQLKKWCSACQHNDDHSFTYANYRRERKLDRLPDSVMQRLEKELIALDAAYDVSSDAMLQEASRAADLTFHGKPANWLKNSVSHIVDKRTLEEHYLGPARTSVDKAFSNKVAPVTGVSPYPKLRSALPGEVAKLRGHLLAQATYRNSESSQGSLNEKVLKSRKIMWVTPTEALQKLAVKNFDIQRFVQQLGLLHYFEKTKETDLYILSFKSSSKCDNVDGHFVGFSKPKLRQPTILSLGHPQAFISTLAEGWGRALDLHTRSEGVAEAITNRNKMIYLNAIHKLGAIRPQPILDNDYFASVSKYLDHQIGRKCMNCVCSR